LKLNKNKLTAESANYVAGGQSAFKARALKLLSRSKNSSSQFSVQIQVAGARVAGALISLELPSLAFYFKGTAISRRSWNNLFVTSKKKKLEFTNSLI
jgi:hypothetical protein